MTRNIDREVIDARLRELAHRLERLAEKRPASIKQLKADEDLQDILARNLELAIQSCIDIAAHICAVHQIVPESAGEAFDGLESLGVINPPLTASLKRATGFRNILAHEYAEIDWNLVMQVMRTDLKDLKAFGKAIVAHLDSKFGGGEPRRRSTS